MTHPSTVRLRAKRKKAYQCLQCGAPRPCHRRCGKPRMPSSTDSFVREPKWRHTPEAIEKIRTAAKKQWESKRA